MTLSASTTSQQWRDFFRSIRFASSRSNNIPASAPRVIRFALGSRDNFFDVHVLVTPANDAPTFWGLLGGGRGAGAFSASVHEGAPADVLLILAPNCSAPPLSAIPSPLLLCAEDPDPLLVRRALVSGAAADTYLGATVLAPSAAAHDDAGFSVAMARFSLNASGAASCRGAALVPVGDPLWDCTALIEGTRAWGAWQATAPANSSSPLRPHAPFGWPLLPSPAWDSPCLAQRYRLAFSAAPPASLPDDGCGTWGGAATAVGCALDHEAAYCGSGSGPPPSPTIELSLTLTDAFPLGAGGARTASATLTLTVVDAPEPPVLAWSDDATLAAVCPSCSLSGAVLPAAAVVDDTTGKQPAPAAGTRFPVLLLCSQDDVPQEAGIRVRALPLEGPSALALAPTGAENATALFAGTPLSVTPTRLNSSAAAPCVAALRATALAGLAAVADAAAPALSGTPWVYVQPYKLEAAPGANLAALPYRALTLLAEPSQDPSGAFLPLPVPVRLVRANRPVSWAEGGPASVAFTERAPPGALAADVLAVTDDDVEQDVHFSVLNASLVSCNGQGLLPGRPRFPVPTGLFALAPVLSSTWVTDAATGKQRSANSTRQARIAVGVDALDIDEPAAACGVAASVTASCNFSLALRARDNGDPSPSHSLLPPQSATSAVRFLSVVVSRASPHAQPAVTAVEGAPSGGLSAAGGDVLYLLGTNLGLPAGPTAAPTLVLTDLGTGDNYTSPCAVVARLSRVRCITPPGNGRALAVSLLWASGERGVIGGAALLGYAEPRIEGVGTGPAPYATVGSTLLSSPLNTSAGANVVAALTNLASPGAGITTLLLRRARGVWGVPLDATATCSAALSQDSAAVLAGQAWRNASALLCALPAAVGGAAAFDAPLHGGNFSTTTPARLSFPPPVITRVLQDCSLESACVRRGTFVVQGVNLGAAGNGSRACWSSDCLPDLAEQSRRAHFLQGFDAVQYAQLPLLPSADCDARAKNGSLQGASCALHAAVNCSYLFSHAAISCELDPSGWGVGFRVRVVVGGQASAWSNDTVAYPAPLLEAAHVVWVSGAERGAPQDSGLLPNGGSLLRLRGAGLAPLSQLVIAIGGVVVRPFVMGGTAHAVEGEPPVGAIFPDGSVARPERARAAPLQAVFVCAPPGLGSVTIRAWVGARSTSLPVNYSSAAFAPLDPELVDFDKTTTSFPGIRFTANLSSLPACALCAANFPSNTGGFFSYTCNASVPTGPCSGTDPCKPYFIPPHHQLSNAPMCPAISVSVLADCALPDALWQWSEQPCPGDTALGAALFTSVIPGHARCAVAPPPLFNVTVAISSTYPVEMEQAGFGSAADGVRLYARVDVGSLALTVSANGATILATPPTRYSKADLLKAQPVLQPQDEAWAEGWAPRGGEVKTLSILNGGASGALVISPEGMQVNPDAGRRFFDTSLLCPTRITDESNQRLPQSGWPAGPIVCPLTMDSTISGTTVTTNYSLRLFPSTTAALPDRLALPDRFDSEGYAVWDSVSLAGSLPPEVKKRLVYEPCATGARWTERNATPCRILTWKPSSSSTSTTSSISFLTPAWQGGVFLSAVVEGVISDNEIPVSYSLPTLKVLEHPPSLPSQGGGALVVRGDNFGNFSSLGELWAASGADQQGYRYRVNTSAATGFLNAIILRYPDTGATRDRPCAVQSWSDSVVTCTLPPGVPNSLNTVLVLHNISVWADSSTASNAWESRESENQLEITYAPPRFFNLSLADGGGALPTQGGFSVFLTGENFGNFSGNKDVGADDCSDHNSWVASIQLLLERPDAGEIDSFSTQPWVKQSTYVRDPEIQLHTHGLIVFTTPPFEGSDVTLAMLFAPKNNPSKGFLLPLYTFDVRPPFFTNVSAIPATPEEKDFSPTQQLALFTPASPPAKQPTTCLDRAWGVRQWNPAELRRSLLPSRPFIRAHKSSGSFTTLHLEGENLGSGSWYKSRVFVLPLKDADRLKKKYPTLAKDDVEGELATFLNTREPREYRAVECKALAGRSLFLKTAGATYPTGLECALAGDLPAGPVDVLVSIAYRKLYQRLSRDPGGITLFAECACGFFSDNLTAGYCEKCPLGGSCRGGGDVPRAIQGAWKTDPEEWKGRFYQVDIAPPDNFPRFVPCAAETRCLPDGVCAANTRNNVSWMCVSCEDSYFLDGNYTCVLCNNELRKNTGLLILSVVLPLVFIGGLFYKFCLKPAMEKEPLLRKKLFAEGKSDDEVEALVPRLRPLSAYVKILITYAQTLGALATYVQASLSPEARSKDVNVPLVDLLPTLLSNFYTTVDFGLLSFSGLRCLLGLTDYFETKRVMMFLPLGTLLVGFSAYFLFKCLQELCYYVFKCLQDLCYYVFCCRVRRPEAASSRTACAPRRWWGHFIQPSHGPQWAEDGVYWAIVLTFLALPVAINALAATQAHAPRTLGGFVREEPAVSWEDPRFIRELRGPTMVAAFSYMFVPVFVGLFLKAGFKNMERYFKFLLEGYRTEDSSGIPRLWECLVLLRKSIFVGLSTGLLALADPRSQLTYTMLVLAAFVALQVHFKPLSSPQLNFAETLALLSELAFSYCAMIRQQGTAGERVFTEDGRISNEAAQRGTNGVELKQVSVTERLAFDLLAAILALLFLLSWLFITVNDKLLQGKLTAALARYFAAKGFGKVDPLVVPPPDADIAYVGPWQLIEDPDKKAIWVPPQLNWGDFCVSSEELEDGKYDRLHVQLPLNGKTAAGWTRMDPRKLIARKDCAGKFARTIAHPSAPTNTTPLHPTRTPPYLDQT